MRHSHSIAIAALLLGGTMMSAQAQNLLEGVIGGPGDDALVTLGSGPASDSGTVNVGVGQGSGTSGNIVDVGIGGGGQRLLEAEVNGGDGLDADVRVGGNLVRGQVGLGGDGLLDADIGILDDTVDVGIGVGGGNGGGGGAGPGSGAGGGTSAGNGSVLANAGNGAGGNVPAACMGTSASQVGQLIQSTEIGSWHQAANVEVQRVSLCPETEAQLRSELEGSGLGQALRSAVAADPLISASLSRTSYDASDVLAVRQSGGRLTVYVY